ncbi:MAG: hypothetical protein AAGC44_11590 [Planctomycetota bacterium]
MRNGGWRTALVVALLAAQAGMMVFARFDDRRFFCWGPHDQQTAYDIHVVIAGEPLDQAQIEQRYRIPAAGYEYRATAHLLGLIEQYEKTLGREDQAQVQVRYGVNGRPLTEVWQWPR